MPGDSRIEWTDATWNPVTGCDQVSPGCDHCYAKTFAERFRGVEGHPYEQGFDLKLWPERLDIPIRWAKPRRIFVNSMSDLFHSDVPTEFIDRVWAAMLLSPHHIFQVLTKRPQRMQRYVSDPDLYRRVLLAAAQFGRERPNLHNIPIADPATRPADHVWLGVSVELQEYAWRIGLLAKTPAAVRFLSCEPLLGPLQLSAFFGDPCAHPSHTSVFGMCPGCNDTGFQVPSPIHWVIAGGESGHGARPVHPDWIRSLRDQCQAADVSFFFKQWGEFAPSGIGSQKWIVRADGSHDPKPTPEGMGHHAPTNGSLFMYRVGKKAAGRELDGRHWDEMPAVRV